MLKSRLAAPVIASIAVLLAGCSVAKSPMMAPSALQSDLEALAKAGVPKEARVLKTEIGTIVAGLLPLAGAAKERDEAAPISEEEADLLGIGIMAKKGKTGNLPAKVDLRNMFAPIRSQGAMGSCTAFATTAVMEAMSNVHGKEGERLSPLFFYYAERKAMEEDGMAKATRKDTGAFMPLAAETAVKVGTTTEKMVPYADGKEGLAYDATDAHFAAAKDFKMKKKVNIKTIPGMKSALANQKPFILAIILYDSFMTRTVMRTGEMMMPMRGEEIQGGHAVTAVGYDDSKQAFLVRNSWGKEWGQGGYFWMPYEYFKPTYIGASRFYGSCYTLE